MFQPAGTAEIIRSHQKDDSFLNSLRTTVAELAQRIAGKNSSNTVFRLVCVGGRKGGKGGKGEEKGRE